MKITRQPQSNVFFNEVFSFDLQLVSPSSRKHKDSPTSSPTRYSALDVHLCLQEGEFDLEILKSPDLGPEMPRGAVECRIRPPTSRKADSLQPCFFQIECSLSSESQLSTKLLCETSRVKVVEYKVRFAPDQWDEIWYKDEGGREKGLDATISLFDSQQEPISHIEVPLHVSLYYQSKMKVLGQDVLRLVGSPDQLAISPTQPKATLSVRIEDVSKNHQGQNFVVKVTAAKKCEFAPVIGEALSPPVNVRSKRSKKAKTSQSRLRSPAATESTSGSVLPGDARLQEALGGVIRWSEEVVNGLYAMQWTPTGYPTLPNGTFDYSRPYFSPNPMIGTILQSYSDSTRGQLQTLHAALSSAGAPGPRPAPMSTPGEHFSTQPFQQAVLDPSAFDPRTPTSGEMEYVLARQYTSLRTGGKLGFPVFSHDKQLLGFYQSYEGDTIRFTPLQDASLQEPAQRILFEELESQSALVHRLSFWGSLQSMLDRCVVYDFQHQFDDKLRTM